jgi:hypothetical protein
MEKDIKTIVNGLEIAFIGYIAIISGEDITEELEALGSIEEKLTYITEQLDGLV